MAEQSILGCLEDSAIFSPCRKWRYTLHRYWGDGPCVVFLMFNPSTADESTNDATIRRCIGFAKRWEYGRLIILNLFSIRSTDPRGVIKDEDPIGPDNDHWILESLRDAEELILAWGCNQHMSSPTLKIRPKTVIDNIKSTYPSMPLKCLGTRKDGSPRHPLMLSYEVERQDLTNLP